MDSNNPVAVNRSLGIISKSVTAKKLMISKVPREFSVLGLPVHLLDDSPGWLLERLQQGQGGHVVTLNAEMTVQAAENPALASAIRQAELVVPDGAGVVLYLQLQGQKVRRCPGIELCECLLKLVGQLGEACPVFFYGGAPEVAEKAVQRWELQVPGLKIVGAQHGFLQPAQQQEFCQTLKQLQPRLILVGLGVPRQEFWIVQHRHLCPQALWIGVGGSFDIWAGVKTRAPGWLRNNNLEWLYRLYQEPWRWRRMLALPVFAWRALLALSFQRKAVS